MLSAASRDIGNSHCIHATCPHSLRVVRQNLASYITHTSSLQTLLPSSPRRTPQSIPTSPTPTLVPSRRNSIRSSAAIALTMASTDGIDVSVDERKASYVPPAVARQQLPCESSSLGDYVNLWYVPICAVLRSLFRPGKLT